MKLLLFLAILTLIVSIDSCSPSTSPPAPTTLVPNRTGKVMTKTDSNSYDFRLSCGCPFPLKVEGADTTNIFYYDLSHLKDTVTAHLIIAKPRLPLASGTYTGWLAITT